ncbi:hypothetical protein GCM10009621_20680 [Corynebacterium felinum]
MHLKHKARGRFHEGTDHGVDKQALCAHAFEKISIKPAQPEHETLTRNNCADSKSPDPPSLPLVKEGYKPGLCMNMSLLCPNPIRQGGQNSLSVGKAD